MPFKSKAQQRWMFVTHPKMAKEWASETDFSKLPDKVKHKKRKKHQAGGVYKTQAEVDAANAFARNFSARKNEIAPQDAYVAKNVGDPVVPFIDATTGKPYVPRPVSRPSNYSATVPDYVEKLDWDSSRNYPYYTDQQTGDLTYTNPDYLNLPRFNTEQRAKGFLASKQTGGVNDMANFRGPVPQMTNLRQGLDDSILSPEEQQKRRKPWNPYFMLRGASTAASFMAGIIDRGRQNQYMMDQLSTLGQLNPMQPEDFQPTPYQQYAQDGGETDNYTYTDKKGKHLIPSRLPNTDKYNNDNAWMQGWIMRRGVRFNKFAEDQYKAEHPFKSLLGVDAEDKEKMRYAMQDTAIKRLKSVKYKDESKIPDDAYVDMVRGEYDPYDHSILFPINPGNATRAHETGHASGIARFQSVKDYINKTIEGDSKYKTKKDSYYHDPDEIYSRIWGYRRTLGLKPEDVVTPELLKQKTDANPYGVDDQDLHEYLDEATIIKLMNELVMNKSQPTSPRGYAKKGGWIQSATKGMRKDKPCTGEKFGSKTCPPGSKRYNLAKTFRKMAKD